MKYYTTIIVLTLSLTALNCSGLFNKNPFEGKQGDEINHVFTKSQTAIQNSDETPQEKAEKYALLGQSALETPRSAHLAIVAFEEALKLDEQNAKANFYSALLLPVLSLKGISVRMAEIVTPKYAQEVTDSILKRISKSEIRSVVSALLNDASAEAVFKTPSEVQQFMTEKLLPTLEESQRRLEIVSQHSDFKVTFNFGNWGYAKLHTLNFFNTTVTLDQIEVKSAKTAMKGMTVWVAIAAAYNLDDAMALRDKYLSKDRQSRRHVTFRDIVEDLKQYPKLLTLNSKTLIANGADLLKNARENISEAVESTKIIANMLGTNKAEREGKLIPAFREYNHYAQCRLGSCVIDDILSGPFAVPIGREGKWNNKDGQWQKGPNQQRTVLVDGTVIFYHPISDLKSLLPTEFDASGKLAKTFPDVTFGGIVPNGDLLSTYCATADKAKNFELPIECSK